MKTSIESALSSLFSLRQFRPFCHVRLIIFVVWACLLSVSYGPMVGGQESPQGLDAPAFVFLRQNPSQFWKAGEMPFPSLIAQGVKEEPEVSLKVLERSEPREKDITAVKAPGCAASGAVRTPPSIEAQGPQSGYKQGMKRYLSGDFEGAIESLAEIADGYPVNELSGYGSYYTGESLYHLGRVDEALAQFQQFVERHPDHELVDWAYYSMGWIHMEQKDFEKALSCFEPIARSQRQSPLEPTALFWEGEALGRSGQVEEAIASKRLFLESWPTHSRAPEVQLSMGEYLFRFDRFSEAAEVFREFVAIYPSHSLIGEARFGLGLSLIFEERYDEGISVLKTLLERFPNTSLVGSILLGLVKGYLGKDDGDAALETYEELVTRSPHFEWTDHGLFAIGYFYFQEGVYARSIEINQHFLRIYPGSDLKGLVYFYLGEAFYALKDYNQAVDSYLLAREATCEDVVLEEVLFKMGLSLFYQETSYRRAIDSWNRLLKEFPDSIRREEAVYRMGEAFLWSGNPKRAMTLFKELEENADIYPRILHSLGLYYFQEGEWGLAIHYFLELLDRYPYHALSLGACLRLGEAFYNRRDYGKALSYLDETVQQEEAQDLDRAYFLQGRIYYIEGRFDLAINRLSHLRTRFPESDWVEESQYWIALSYYRAGMYEKAIGEFAQVVENPPSSKHASQALLRIGDCYYNRGSYAEATHTYLQVIREFPHSREAPEAEYGILLAFEGQGMHDSFVEKAKGFFATYPTHPLGANILSKLAQYELENNMVNDAIASYKELLGTYPRSDLADDAQFKLGGIYREQQDFKNAILEFGQVVKQYPGSNYLVDAYFEIAESHFALGDYRRALEGYRRVVRGFPENRLARTAYLRAAECFEKLDRRDFAEKTLMELLESYPNDPIRFQGALRLGLILYEDVRYAEAIKALRDAVESGDPEVASLAQIKIGEVYRKMGDSTTAAVELMKVVYLYPGQVGLADEALFQAGEIYVEQRRWADAREVYSKVIETSRTESARQKARTILIEIDRRTGNE